MAKKKKNRKKSSQQLNSHKLSEKELIHRVKENINLKKIDSAYKLLKVLIQRFDCSENRKLLKSVLDQKVLNLMEEGKVDAIETLIKIGKKQLPAELFKDAETQLKLRRMNPSELLEEYQTQEKIPESFRYEFADTLFFSKKINREFIKKHKEYKDLFYVKEAFAQGYDQIKTKNLMTPINSASPFKYWLLLRKGIEAFLEDDSATLQLISNKIKFPIFPKFLLKKLVTCQNYLEQGLDSSTNLPAEDVEVLAVLLGEKFPEQLLTRRLGYLIKKRQIVTAQKVLRKASREIDSDHYSSLYILVSAAHFDLEKGGHKFDRFLDKLAFFPRMEEFYLNKDHLILKLLGISMLSEENLTISLKKVLRSKELKKCALFEPDLLKAELYFYLAKNIADDTCSQPESIFSFHRTCYTDFDAEISEYLENSLSLSQHNPRIYVTLINHLIESKEKTSAINVVIKKFITRFPENHEGYKIAGDIALKNKTYQKAIDFYHKAYQLMPLNRELVLTIFQCFSKIILRRTYTNAHLIKKDILNVEVYAHTTHKTIQLELCLLKTLALTCQIKLISGENEAHFDRLKELYSVVKEDLLSSFRFFSQLEEAFSQKQLSTYFKNERKKLTENFSTSDFSKITDHFFEYNGDSPLSLWFEFLVPLLKSEKRDPTLNINKLIKWVYLALTRKLYNTFKAFVYLGYHNYPKDFRWAFLVEILKDHPDIKKILKFLCHKNTLDWLHTDQGVDLLRALFEEDYYLNDLFHIIVDIRDYKSPPENHYDMIRDEFTKLLYHFIDPFSSLRCNLLETVSPLDRAPIGKINKIFKISMKNKMERKSQPQEKLKNSQLNFFDFLDN